MKTTSKLWLRSIGSYISKFAQLFSKRVCRYALDAFATRSNIDITIQISYDWSKSEYYFFDWLNDWLLIEMPNGRKKFGLNWKSRCRLMIEHFFVLIILFSFFFFQILTIDLNPVKMYAQDPIFALEHHILTESSRQCLNNKTRCWYWYRYFHSQFHKMILYSVAIWFFICTWTFCAKMSCFREFMRIHLNAV